jgi:pyridoxal 5'-phosphate synthase pdxT subunit
MLPVGVLALQGDFREHEQMLQACGVETLLVRDEAGLAKVSGLVLPGGESTAISKLAVSFDLVEPLQARITAGLPVYGSCAGMIMLASTLVDGRSDQITFSAIDMSVRRNAFGRQVDSFEAELNAPKITTEPITAVFIRAPWVEQVGAGVEILAKIETGLHSGAIVAVQQGAVMATSFHPELTSDLRIHKYFLNLVHSA